MNCICLFLLHSMILDHSISKQCRYDSIEANFFISPKMMLKIRWILAFIQIKKMKTYLCKRKEFSVSSEKWTELSWLITSNAKFKMIKRKYISKEKKKKRSKYWSDWDEVNWIENSIMFRPISPNIFFLIMPYNLRSAFNVSQLVIHSFRVFLFFFSLLLSREDY